MLSVKDLFKHYLGLEPNASQVFTSLISLPWSFKIFYGLVADNFPIWGSRRRSYVILNGLVQTMTLWALALHVVEDAVFVTTMLFLNSLNSAFLDVVVDALMVTQSRKDPEHGSEDLQGLSWSLLAIGGILGAICSAFFTEYLQPFHTFLACSFFSMLIVVAGYYINPEVETQMRDSSFDGDMQPIGFVK